MPFYPYQLTVAVRIVDIADGVSSALNHKANSHRIIRVGLPAAHLHRGDHIGIDSVFIVEVVYIGRLQLTIEADNTDAKRRDDLIVADLAVGAARPCGIAQICFFKEDGQRQILMGERSHLASKISVYLLVIERRFRGRHGIVGSTVDEVGDRLDNDFVIAGNKRIKVYSYISGNRPNDLLVCKVASNRRNAGGIVAGRNDARQTLRRTDADIAAHDR